MDNKNSTLPRRFSLTMEGSLCCPITREHLHLVGRFELAKLSEKTIQNNADYFLMSNSGKIAYPVNDGVPYLTVEHAIGNQLPRSPIPNSHHYSANVLFFE